MITLRDYQVAMLDDARAALRQHRSVVIQSECGSGKGTITGVIIEGALRKGKYVLFLVHGKDRVNDQDERVTKLDIKHGVLMGGRRREHQHPVQIASSDTVHRMEFKPKADLIVIDECHRALSPTFRAILDLYPDSKIIGLSATPMLGTGKALGVRSGGIFESMVKGPSVNTLIREGHLVGSRIFAPPAPTDLKGLKKKSTGEFDSEQGAAICDTSKVIGDLVEHWKRHASDRKTAVFGFNQKHAYDIAESFRAAGVNWAYVDANTPDGDIHTPGTRKFFWHQLEFGDLVGVASVGCIEVGWDAPCCKALILASKTASFPRYRQRLGRGSRPYKDFKDFLVLDHCAGLYEFEEQGPYFESEIDWQLDGDNAVRTAKEEPSLRIATCKVPLKTPDDGVPPLFRGPLSPDGRFLLPCFSVFAVGPKQCPYCGLPLEVNTRKIEVEAGDLQEITMDLRQKSATQLNHELKMRLRYLELAKIGATSRKRNGEPYSQFWASVSFKNQFHRWPTKAWKDEARAMTEALHA